MGNGSYSQVFTIVSLLLSSLSPAPAWDSSHGRQSSRNFSNMSPSHNSFQTVLLRVSPMECSPSGTACSVWVPHRVTLFTGPQHLAGACSSWVSPWETILHSILQSHLSAPLCTLWTGCRGTAFLPMVFTTRFMENSALAPGTLLPSSSLILASAELSYTFSFLSSLATVVPAQELFPVS